MMRIIKCIKLAINKGLLQQPFTAKDVYKALQKINDCNYELKTLSSFLPKHRENNPGNKIELFKRFSKGKYILK